MASPAARGADDGGAADAARRGAGAALLPLAAKPARGLAVVGVPHGARAPIRPLSAGRRWYMVILFSLMVALLASDQNLLAPNLSAAARDLGLDERQRDVYLGGYVMSAFFFVGAPAALVCGYLADRMNRVHLLFAVAIVGQGPCLATYFVSEFWQFLALRLLTGVAGGVFPLTYSLLGDLFPRSQRTAMASLVQIATGVGIGGGQLVAGMLGPAAGWRLPFVVVAAPAIALALVMVATVEEPPRGAYEEALAEQYAAGIAYDETITWAKARVAARAPSNWILVLQAVPGCLPWGVLQTYMNDYLSQEKGFSVQLATLVLLLFGIGSAVGVIVGGMVGQMLYNWRKETVALLSGAAAMAGIAPLCFLINSPLAIGPAGAMAFLAGFVVSVPGPNLRATMINVNDPETRGIALACQSVTDDLGRGAGPIIVAGFISSLGGRQAAFNVAVAGWLPCGLIILLLAFFMRRDEAAVQKRLATRAEAGARRRAEAAAAVGADGGARGGAPPPPPAATLTVVVDAPASDGGKEGAPAPGGSSDGGGGGDGDSCGGAASRASSGSQVGLLQGPQQHPQQPHPQR